MIDALRQDLRYACRHLRRSPWFAATAILTLAFGIGANTAMASILNALVLQPLPIPDPDGLIGVSGRSPQDEVRLTLIPAVDVLARDQRPLRQVCGYNGGVVLSVEVSGTPTQTIGALMTADCLEAFGVRPIVGRDFAEDETSLYGPGAPVALIGHRFWTRFFNADPTAVGRTLRTEGIELRVIGVLPRDFGGLHADSGAEIFVPFDTIFPSRADRRPGASHILGRLAPGVSIEEARAMLQAGWPSLLESIAPVTLPPSEREDLRNARPRVERIGTGTSFYRDRYSRPAWLLTWLTAALLALACLNLSGLLLSRLSARAHEIALRQALGGSRTRIARQMLAESLLLSLAGAALAIPIAFAIVGVLVSYLPPTTVESSKSWTPDRWVLGFTALVGVVAGALMSTLPIWVAGRRGSLTGFGWTRTVAGTTSRWNRALLVGQVTLSIVLVVGATLLTRSLYALQRVDWGVRRDGIVTAALTPLPNAYRDIDNASYYPALLERLAALPGVRSAAAARMFPRMTGDIPGQPIAIIGESSDDARAILETVSPGFFETLGIPLLEGRAPEWTDNEKSRQVAVINARLARQLSPAGSVLGRRVRFGSDRLHQDVLVVGVVDNATLGNPRAVKPPIFYRPMLQTGRFGNYPRIVLAATAEPSALADGIREAVGSAGREFVREIAPLDAIFARAPSSERMSAALAVTIAGLAVVLAFVGVYSLLAHNVARRAREIGVRTALGASRARVLRMVMREGLILTCIGIIMGLPAAIFAARGLRTLFFGVSELDPWTLIFAVALFASAGTLAGLIPARRAAAIDPMDALRSE